ncbi:extracellular solute-binding protein [Aquibacillus koreensis]|uniref:Extracellular solute-binding protein n=1 Tax=Aquibacillus koreensis TaxID=279446 RepID=A0A9X4AJZ4_9BACI|nr:extracellular solute-binding protein [Aquibacillus koreensis]MCT2537012.1 extracellular solute-binding protein [Aquibacillus koreensis]MDC3422334.1 extracellular solute-binding protein [Aquibacillus koreensis]
MKFRLLLVFLLSLVVIVGCNPTNTDVSTGGENEPENESGNDTETESGSESNESSEPEEDVTLTLWHIEDGPSGEAIEAAVDRFEEKNPGVTVEVSQQENDPYKSKLVVAMGGGNPPDVFSSWGGGWLEQFVNAGQVKEITNDIDQDIYVEAALSASTYGEKVYGAPIGMAVVPVFYNKEIFADLGIEEPETFDDLTAIVETLKENDIIPFTLANQSKWTGSFYLMYLAERMGGPDLFSEAYNRTGRGFDDEAYIEAGHKLQELVEMEAFPEGVNGMNYDTGQSRQLLYSGKAGMQVMGNWLVNNVRDEMPEFEEKLGFFLFPAIEGGQGAKNHIVGGVSPVFSVSESSEHQDLATELVKELASLETSTQMANTAGDISAIKGVEYEDPYVQEISDVLESSEAMQTYYDQTLPPELAQVHLDTTQALIGLSMTPEEAMAKVEEKAKELLD